MIESRESSLDVGRKIQICKNYEIYVSYTRYGNRHLRLNDSIDVSSA